jgi:hypothetical protein
MFYGQKIPAGDIAGILYATKEQPPVLQDLLRCRILGDFHRPQKIKDED